MMMLVGKGTMKGVDVSRYPQIPTVSPTKQELGLPETNEQQKTLKISHPKKETNSSSNFQPSIFWCNSLVSGRIFTKTWRPMTP